MVATLEVPRIHQSKVAPVRTYTPKPAEIERTWYVVDATDCVLGRMSTEVARVLRGKHKPIFAPHMDTGDHVIIINADKVKMTANKADRTFAYRHSGFPGGLTKTSYRELLETKPDETVRNAIRGMLPKNRLGRSMIMKLKVYSGPTHPHSAQNPQPLEIVGAKRVETK